jgi:hypothetical protein
MIANNVLREEMWDSEMTADVELLLVLGLDGD